MRGVQSYCYIFIFFLQVIVTREFRRLISKKKLLESFLDNSSKEWAHNDLPWVEWQALNLQNYVELTDR